MNNVLITGGTGSFGQAMARRLLDNGVGRVVIYSRDEVKQDAMRSRFNDPRLRFFLGDVRDKDRLKRALSGVDTVFHAAALKRVPQGEYDPGEFIKTNILGTLNACEASVDAGVRCVVSLSTDKATSPTNLYGATKLCAEKLTVAANAYAPGKTRLMGLRYGNVAGSRGSVIPLWQESVGNGVVPMMTAPEMTRFWITLAEAVDLALRAAKEGRGGEVFIPHLSAYRLPDLWAALVLEKWGTATATYTGVRPGEKLHEAMVSPDEVHLVRNYGTHLCLHPTHPWVQQRTDGTPITDAITSDTAPRLSVVDLLERLKDV